MKNNEQCNHCKYPKREGTIELIKWVKRKTINEICKKWIFKNGGDKYNIAKWIEKEFLEP